MSMTYIFFKSLSHNLYFMAWLILAVFLLVRKNRSVEILVVKIGMLAMLWLMGTRPAAELALRPLENAYSEPSIEWLQQQNYSDIVVLTGGGFNSTKSSLHSQNLGLSTLSRLTAAMELCVNLNNQPQLVFTGSTQDCPIAMEMAKFAKALNPAFCIQIDTTALRTLDHPDGVRDFVRSKRIILVTSASHIPRSMSVFSKAGFDPVAYPVDFRYPEKFELIDLIPSVRNLHQIQIALYEYQAMVLYWLKD